MKKIKLNLGLICFLNILSAMDIDTLYSASPSCMPSIMETGLLIEPEAAESYPRILGSRSIRVISYEDTMCQMDCFSTISIMHENETSLLNHVPKKYDPNLAFLYEGPDKINDVRQEIVKEKLLVKRTKLNTVREKSTELMCEKERKELIALETKEDEANTQLKKLKDSLEQLKMITDLSKDELLKLEKTETELLDLEQELTAITSSNRRQKTLNKPDLRQFNPKSNSKSKSKEKIQEEREVKAKARKIRGILRVLNCAKEIKTELEEMKVLHLRSEVQEILEVLASDREETESQIESEVAPEEIKVEIEELQEGPESEEAEEMEEEIKEEVIVEEEVKEEPIPVIQPTPEPIVIPVTPEVVIQVPKVEIDPAKVMKAVLAEVLKKIFAKSNRYLFLASGTPNRVLKEEVEEKNRMYKENAAGL